MDGRYQTLQIVFELASKHDRPLSCHLSPREIILRLAIDWDLVVLHLQELKREGLLEIDQQDIARISLTNKGFALASGIRGNAAA